MEFAIGNVIASGIKLQDEYDCESILRLQVLDKY